MQFLEKQNIFSKRQDCKRRNKNAKIFWKNKQNNKNDILINFDSYSSLSNKESFIVKCTFKEKKHEKPKIISVSNQKGGVGKTTTTINLATAMVSFNKKILIVDLDPQGNASTGLGIDLKERDKNIYKVMTSETEVNDCVFDTIIPDLKLFHQLLIYLLLRLSFQAFKNVN